MKMLLGTPPHSAAVFGEEPYSSNPKLPYSPDLTMCKVSFFQRFRIGHPQKKIKQTKTASLTASNIKRGLQMCFQQWPDH